MKKLVIAAVVAAAVGGVVYANYTATQEVKKVVDKQLSALSSQSGVDITYSDISASVFSSSMQLSGINVQSIEGDETIATIDNIEVTGYEVDAIPPHTGFVMTNFRFSDEFLSQLPDSANNKLAATSYNVNSSLDYNKESGDSKFALNVKASEVADVRFNLGLANSTALMEASLSISQAQNAANGAELTLEQQLQQQSKMMAAMSQLEPRSIELEINDDGELKTVVESFLKAQGMTLDDLEQVVAMQLQQAPVSAELDTAIKNFASGLSKLSLSARLPEGKSMMQINQQIMMLVGQPEELAKFINLKASGE
ncbi:MULTISPECIES: hypothetical protein [Pseudoalteromonas]|jgi:hypothetical protein|uniref:DUF945 domain-containing protein n=1 Tax=Pseudoalteromonas lipolytica TaxID=570156 RepID=A0ABY1GQZ8_9GAMM|nr:MULTISPECIES: hypothetical protein [Pseudoalteromonas]MBE0351749.1 hypothetical protein [Pseudoalteromonas lipolytica LMEB 39]MCC9662383.1 hypothetical protein [Pseudoalteromonas sp. MB41]QMW15226.1 hypothetical protein H3302_03705 [Pseudoalteromonas sp. MT33b]QPL43608.1 hypothetical protein IT970_03865 [Pseudoalteromonas sp. A41-2]SFT87430.1 hypothetical protein SAMN04487854_11334 [Pseudoalteromonas lipolytica]